MGKDELPGCEYCKHYEVVNCFMYCKLLQRRITARKKPCKDYELNPRINNSTVELS